MVSKGQALLESITAYLNRYVALPSNVEGQDLVLALWAIHTWMYERFPSTPYLTVTASTKQAGKTLCMEVLKEICRGGKMFATLRPLMLVRVIEAFEGRCTLFLDEAEKMGSAALGDLRSIMTSGYRVGGVHGITADKSFKEFRTYAPKCFALIGDVVDVVRDRSIVIYLRRAQPAVDFLAHRGAAEQEARMIQAGILAYFAKEVPAMVEVTALKGREREIWTVLYSIAEGLKLDAATMERLQRATSDLIGLKSAEARSYSAVQESEVEAGDVSMGEQALLDLDAVLDAPTRKLTGNIHSAEAVRRLKAISTSPWRTFKGRGLDVDALADLVSRFNVKPKNLRMERGESGLMLKGYNGEAVRLAAATLRTSLKR